MTSPSPSSQLYAEFVYNGNENGLQFWGPIPKNIKEAITTSLPLITAYKDQQPLFTQERFATLIQTTRDLHKHHKMLTDQAKKHLTRFEEDGAAVEAGHQPVLMGGPGFVINKLAAIAKIATFQHSTPIMFVGDHDHEQKELTVIHLPSPGPRGLTFSIQVSREYQQSPMHVLPLPPKDWLLQVIEKISSTYHELVAGSAKDKLNQNAERIKTLTQIIETTYHKAKNISEWTMLIWMHISNLSRDTGILFQVFSNPTIRKLMLPAFEHLLKSRNRLKFLKALNTAAEQLQHLGYEPGIGIRANDYVPFHLECPTKGCNRTRLDPTLTSHTSQTKIELTARCPKCNTTHSLNVKATTPDLTEWQNYLSPRVDTRAFLVQSYTPVILHVGGAGETSYYAQVSPALSALDSVVPVFFRYTRIYYENPWTTHQAQRLTHQNLAPLNQNELQCFTSAILTAYSEENSGVIQSLFAASQEHITETAQRLIQTQLTIEKQREELISQQRQTTDQSLKKQYQEQIGTMTLRRQIIQTYLSQMFGRYSIERMGQEASFAWIDAAMSFGPKEHFPRLLAHYHLYTPSSATFYLKAESPT